MIEDRFIFSIDGNSMKMKVLIMVFIGNITIFSKYFVFEYYCLLIKYEFVYSFFNFFVIMYIDY